MDFRPTVTVVVCTHKRPGHLKNCLASLARQSYAFFEVLVVESGSAGSARQISRANGADYIHEPVAGISRARNAGVRASRSDVVVFIDDDAVADAGWLDSLVPVFCDPSIGAATGGTRYMKSHGNERFMSDVVAQEPSRPHRVFSRNDEGWFASASFGGIGDGMNMAFRRSVLALQVRFDERLGRGRLLDGGDEHVAFLRVLAIGYRIAHVPTALVRHPAPANAHALAVQRFELMRSSIAYMLFLWSEFPEYRLDLARFVWRAVRRRLKKNPPGTTATEPMPRWQALRAVISGPAIYLKARQSWKDLGIAAVESPEQGAIRPGYRRPAAQPTANSPHL
jgi:glycosyltransferase involved in cell wall biosynthesis